MEQRFYICHTCGNIIAYARSSGVPVFCCGKKMEEIEAKQDDAIADKHVPVVTVEGNKVIVSVGKVPHAMDPDHYIEWISLETKEGNQRKILKPGEEPKAEFMITDTDKVKVVYAYCNLLSLWKTEL